MSRSLDECEHGGASGHCSYCQEVDELRKKLAIAKEALGNIAEYENGILDGIKLYSAIQTARLALSELDGETK